MAMPAAPTPPRFEHHTDESPLLGVGTAAPRLSWTIPDAEAGYRQTAYEVEITRRGAVRLHRIKSREQILVPWPAEPLASRESASVRVRVAHQDGWSEWSAPAVVEAGLLDVSDWVATFISPVGLGATDMPAPIVTSALTISGEISTARLYVTAHGVYVATLNDSRVGDAVLTPGWTSYPHRLRYQTYDVTDLVHSGTTRWMSCSATDGIPATSASKENEDCTATASPCSHSSK